MNGGKLSNLDQMDSRIGVDILPSLSPSTPGGAFINGEVIGKFYFDRVRERLIRMRNKEQRDADGRYISTYGGRRRD